EAGPNVTSYTWWGASPGTTYRLYVSAYNATGESLPSNVVTVTTLAPPAAPGNLVATPVSGDHIDLTWADRSTNEDRFKLYVSTDGVNWTWCAEAAANATSYSWWGASPGTTYRFYATAANGAGDSGPSNVATATTPVPPAAPSNLTATA